ncbi:hypothetical protein DWX59_18100 [Enterocloster aldenensis]|nr:cysteine-rich VLP protein [Clostridiales bacterium]MBS6855513.1 cysteine-rich VLP protein [Clostridiales bacterium]RGC25618.1 hypothetical protein DWX59_18100 [Enterocloster aldenensis]
MCPEVASVHNGPKSGEHANAIIRWECCNCKDGNCIALDNGDTCTCPQIVSFSVCGGMFVPKSNREKSDGLFFL